MLYIFDGTNLTEQVGTSRQSHRPDDLQLGGLPYDLMLRGLRWWQIDASELKEFTPLGPGQAVAGRSTTIYEHVWKGTKASMETKLWLDADTGVVLKKSHRSSSSTLGPSELETEDWEFKEIHFGPVDKTLFQKKSGRE